MGPLPLRLGEGCGEGPFYEFVPAPDLMIQGIDGTIGAKTVMYDFEALMDGATLLKCSAFADAIIEHMGAGVAVGA